MNRPMYSLALRSVLLFLLSALPALAPMGRLFAQTTGSGSITGLVTDPTGAVIAAAEVTATSAATGIAIVRKTTNSGLFTLQPLNVGDYVVTINANGFGQHSTEKIHVDALQVITLDIKLSLSAEFSVDVTTGGLNDANPSIGDSVNSQDYQLLPLVMNGGPRDPTAFIGLANGINTRGGYNGGLGYNNETYLDGVVATSINQQGAAQNTSSGAIVEAVEQSEVQTVGISAKYQGQGFNNFTLKSGTNQFHGSVFEFFRNTVLDTWNYLSKQQVNALGQTVKPNEKQNEYGGAFGGPIIKDKAFFFAAYEKMNFRQSPNPAYVTLPTLAMRNGDFTGYAAATGYHIYDPDTTTCNASRSVCSRAPFMGPGGVDTIPMSRFSPIALKLQAGLPTNFANANYINNYLVGQSFGTNYYKASAKGDYQLTQKHRLTMEYLTGQSAPVAFNSGTVLPLPYSATSRTVYMTNTAIVGLNSALTPHLVNDVKYSFLRNENVTSDPVTGGDYAATKQGLGPLPAGWGGDSYPVVIFNGNNSFVGIDSANGNGSTNRPSNAFIDTLGVTDDLQWTVGRHNLSFGGTFIWYEYNSELPTGNSAASYTVDTSTSSNFVLNASTGSTSISPTQGSSYAGFLLGDLSAYYVTSSNLFTSIGSRFKAISPYFQDDWTVNKSLTLNLGVRWDLYTPYREVLDRITFFNPDVQNAIVPSYKGGVTYGGSRGTSSCNCHNRYSTYLGNIQPRLGFAFKASPDTVIHGAFGITTTHSGGEGGRGGASGGTSQFGLTASQYVGQVYGYEPVVQWDHPLPVAPAPLLDATYGIGNTTTPGFTGTPTIIYYDEPQLARRSTYFENFSFGIQKQVLPKTLISLDYSGSLGHFLGDSNGHGVFSNQVQPQYLMLGGLLGAAATPANYAAANSVLVSNGMTPINLPYANYDTTKTLGQALRPWPMYAISEIFAQDANSAYNGFQFSLKQQAYKGLSLTINYTYSRLIDDGASRTSVYNTTHRWNVDNGPESLKIYGSWVTPGVQTDHRLVHGLTSGWIVSTIYNYNSAAPLSFGTNCNSYFGYFGGCRPTLNPQFAGNIRNNLPYGPANFKQPAFQPSAFITSTTAFGNSPLNNPYGATGPSTYTWDGSVRRRFAFRDKNGLTIGADAFNITNHTEATGLQTNITNRTFGMATSQSNRSRDIQLSAKIEF